MTTESIPLFRSVRLRLTFWYVLAFGGLLMAFSFYVLSSVSRDLRHQFDKELLNSAANTASYFEEFAEKQNIIGGARETVRELKRGEEQLAIFRGNELLAATGRHVAGL